jgi:hypothetical protein
MDVAALAELLHETAERHGSFEALAPPHDWWDWYAAYMDAGRSGSAPDEASDAAGLFMANVKHVGTLVAQTRVITGATRAGGDQASTTRPSTTDPEGSPCDLTSHPAPRSRTTSCPTTPTSSVG